MAVAIAPHGGHGHMGVGVDQTGHEDAPLAVNDPRKGSGGLFGAHRGDLAALHRHKGVGENGAAGVHEYGGDILKEDRHGWLLSGLHNYIFSRHLSTSSEKGPFRASAVSLTSSPLRG